MIEIRIDDLSGQATQALLAYHLRAMHADSPSGSVFALDLAGLQTSNITVWTAWIGDAIAGVAAPKTLGDGSVELKSMRTAPDFLRQGVASALLDHIIAFARNQRFHRVSLETGSGPAFQPALGLYRSRGFKNGPPFALYEPSGFNQFLHMSL